MLKISLTSSVIILCLCKWFGILTLDFNRILISLTLQKKKAYSDASLCTVMPIFSFKEKWLWIRKKVKGEFCSRDNVFFMYPRHSSICFEREKACLWFLGDIRRLPSCPFYQVCVQFSFVIGFYGPVSIWDLLTTIFLFQRTFIPRSPYQLLMQQEPFATSFCVSFLFTLPAS